MSPMKVMKVMKAARTPHDPAVHAMKKPAAAITKQIPSKKPAAPKKTLVQQADAWSQDDPSSDNEETNAADDPLLKNKGMKWAKDKDNLPEFIKHMYEQDWATCFDVCKSHT